MQPFRARGIAWRAFGERAIHKDHIGPMNRPCPDERQPDGLRDGAAVTLDCLRVVASGDGAIQTRIGAAAKAASPRKDSMSDLWIAAQRLELEILGMICCLLEHAQSFMIQVQLLTQPQHSTPPGAAPPFRSKGIVRAFWRDGTKRPEYA
jgi:hypothetical protein